MFPTFNLIINLHLDNPDEIINIKEELTNKTVSVGDNLNLTCEFLTQSNITVYWHKDKEQLVIFFFINKHT